MAKLEPTKWIWRDGEMIAWDDAVVHVCAHSMQFGSSVFEGVRCYETPNGPAIFRLAEHLQRMINSCKIYRMELAYSVDDLIAACCEVVDRNEMESCYLRPMVVRGFGAAGMVPFDSPIEVYIPCWPWGAYLGADALTSGVDACVSAWHRVAPNTIPAGAKIAGNYLSGQLVKMEALANGYSEGISLSTDGMISEGSGQNTFVVQGGTLYTSPVDGTLLPGITRLSILTLAQHAGIPVREQRMPREMLYTADEVFLTGTASEVTPVRSVDKIVVGTGKPGPITQQMQRAYMQTVKGEIPDTHGWLTHVRAERASRRT